MSVNEISKAFVMLNPRPLHASDIKMVFSNYLFKYSISFNETGLNKIPFIRRVPVFTRAFSTFSCLGLWCLILDDPAKGQGMPVIKYAQNVTSDKLRRTLYC